MRLPIFIAVIFGFVVVASFGLFVLRAQEVPERTYASQGENLDIIVPRLTSYSIVPTVSARAVYAVDIGSQEVLYEKNPYIPYLPASTTKMMTALVAMENYSPSEILVVPKIAVDGQKMGLISGESISVESLLYGTLVFSANDAAEVLAYYYPGGRSAFVAEMNRRAYSLGMEESVFKNPTGLDETGHLSSASDLVNLATYLMEDKYFSQIVGTEEASVGSVDIRFRHELVNINTLLGEVEGVVGVKTGWTEGAGENLVVMVDRDDRQVMMAIMGSEDRFGEARELIEWIYSNYSWERL